MKDKQVSPGTWTMKVIGNIGKNFNALKEEMPHWNQLKCKRDMIN